MFLLWSFLQNGCVQRSSCVLTVRGKLPTGMAQFLCPRLLPFWRWRRRRRRRRRRLSRFQIFMRFATDSVKRRRMCDDGAYIAVKILCTTFWRSKTGRSQSVGCNLKKNKQQSFPSGLFRRSVGRGNGLVWVGEYFCCAGLSVGREG